MYQRILVAVDGSKTSGLALRESIRLALDQHAALRIVHVVDEVTLNWEGESLDIGQIQESFRKSGQSILEKSGNVARESGMAAETRLLEIQTFGHRVADMIVDNAKTWRADLIVIGTHGRRGLHHLLMGSVAEGVVRISLIPVLLIRGK